MPPSTLLYRLKDEYVAYPTNYVLAYSNLAMALLGLMVEQVSDTEFSEHLNQSIFGVERKWLGLFSQKKIGALELTKIRAGRMDVAGRELLIVRYDGRHWFTAEKIDPLPLPETWENALGKYEVMNSDPEGSIQDITLSREEDLLVFAYTFPVWSPGKKIMYFTSISETEAITLGIGRNSGETMRIVNMDNQKGIYFLGFKMKKSPS